MIFTKISDPFKGDYGFLKYFENFFFEYWFGAILSIFKSKIQFFLLPFQFHRSLSKDILRNWGYQLLYNAVSIIVRKNETRKRNEKTEKWKTNEKMGKKVNFPFD